MSITISIPANTNVPRDIKFLFRAMCSCENLTSEKCGDAHCVFLGGCRSPQRKVRRTVFQNLCSVGVKTVKDRKAKIPA